MSQLQTLLASHRAGANVGLYSVCCSNEQVLRAAMHVALAHGTVLLIEATSNQVDQFGGYTGMTPPQYRDYVGTLADEEGFPRERLILGGDHLGPNAWQKRPGRRSDDPRARADRSLRRRRLPQDPPGLQHVLRR